MKFRITEFEFFTHLTRTRFPFRYGIASMSEVPHQFVRVHLELENGPVTGLASEGLPPKWFTKDPDTEFADDLEDMQRVIHHAADQARDIASKPIGYFDFWSELSRRQSGWAANQGYPPLLSNLGVALCERAVLDALCRAADLPLHALIRSGQLGLRLGDLHAELASADPVELLPSQPLGSVCVRHTVGLGDPLTASDVTDEDRADDGLPQDLESSIREYGLRYFKIKLSGKPDTDLGRLRTIHELLRRGVGMEWQVTLDGNENFADFAAFRAFWEELSAAAFFDEFARHVLVVEQPVHRAHALSDGVAGALREWKDHPPLIIDESDGALGDLERALELGYAGTSHKNCKGIVKGLTNACFLAQRRRAERTGVLTGEDLANLGPVALLQDLAMMALLGVEHVERNGHHYFRGLSMWPEDWQEAMPRSHPDLYHRHPAGFACVHIQQGRIGLQSVNEAPFGCGPLLDPEALPRGVTAAAPMKM